MWPWRVKMPTKNLLRLLLFLMLIMRIVLATVCCRFGSWGLDIKLTFVQTFSTRFGQEFEVEAQARFWSWSLVRILLLMFGLGYKVESWKSILCNKTPQNRLFLRTQIWVTWLWEGPGRQTVGTRSTSGVPLKTWGYDELAMREVVGIKIEKKWIFG